jgi:hypothetical protein
LKSEDEKEAEISVLAGERRNSAFSTGINYEDLIKELNKTVETKKIIYEKIQNFSKNYKKKKNNVEEVPYRNVEINDELQKENSQNKIVEDNETHNDEDPGSDNEKIEEKFESQEENSISHLKLSQPLMELKSNTVSYGIFPQAVENSETLSHELENESILKKTKKFLVEHRKNQKYNEYYIRKNFKIYNITND